MKYLKHIFWISTLSCIICIVFMDSQSVAQEQVFVYPRPESESDQRTIYPVKLLELGLKKTGIRFRLQPSVYHMQQGRALVMLANDSDLHVAWSMSSIEREAKLLPIRIPIYKGLIGWRIFLINQADQAKFQKVQGIDGLKRYEAGQGHDWPDTKILRSNGLRVTGSNNYESLFKMLQVNRFDYFPRSIVEIWAEVENHKTMGIVVEESIALRYPTAFYFFVNQRNVQLAELLKKGLNQSIKDGSFNKLFNQYHQGLLQQANLNARRIFDLNNPILPKQTPLNRKELWFTID